jgi:hypothetical protein
MLDAIDGALRFNRNLFQPNPNQNSATDMISDDPRFATLISFQTGQLLGFAGVRVNVFTDASIEPVVVWF